MAKVFPSFFHMVGRILKSYCQSLDATVTRLGQVGRAYSVSGCWVIWWEVCVGMKCCTSACIHMYQDHPLLLLSAMCIHVQVHTYIHMPLRYLHVYVCMCTCTCTLKLGHVKLNEISFQIHWVVSVCLCITAPFSVASSSDSQKAYKSMRGSSMKLKSDLVNLTQPDSIYSYIMYVMQLT